MSKVDARTVARTICLFMALVNQVLTIMGHSMINIDDETITTAVSSIWVIAAALWAWWKNNSFTETAIAADNYLNELREGIEYLNNKDNDDTDK